MKKVKIGILFAMLKQIYLWRLLFKILDKSGRDNGRRYDQ